MVDSRPTMAVSDPNFSRGSPIAAAYCLSANFLGKVRESAMGVDERRKKRVSVGERERERVDE